MWPTILESILTVLGNQISGVKMAFATSLILESYVVCIGTGFSVLQNVAETSSHLLSYLIYCFFCYPAKVLNVAIFIKHSTVSVCIVYTVFGTICLSWSIHLNLVFLLKTKCRFFCDKTCCSKRCYSKRCKHHFADSGIFVDHSGVNHTAVMSCMCETKILSENCSKRHKQYFPTFSLTPKLCLSARGQLYRYDVKQMWNKIDIGGRVCSKRCKNNVQRFFRILIFLSVS